MSSLPQANIAEEHFLLGNPLETLVAKATSVATDAVTAVTDAVGGDKPDDNDNETDTEDEPQPGNDESPVDDNAKEIKTQTDVFKATDGKDGGAAAESFLQSRTEHFLKPFFETRGKLFTQMLGILDVSVPYGISTICVIILMVFALFLILNTIIRSAAAPGPFQTFGRYISYPMGMGEKVGNPSTPAALSNGDFEGAGSSVLKADARAARIDFVKYHLYGGDNQQKGFNPFRLFKWFRSLAEVGAPITAISFGGPSVEWRAADDIEGYLMRPDEMRDDDVHQFFPRMDDLFRVDGDLGTLPTAFNKEVASKSIYLEAHRQLMREGKDLFPGREITVAMRGEQSSNRNYSTAGAVMMSNKVLMSRTWFFLILTLSIAGYWVVTDKMVSNLEENSAGKLKLKKGGGDVTKGQFWYSTKMFLWLFTAMNLVGAYIVITSVVAWHNTRDSVVKARPPPPPPAPRAPRAPRATAGGAAAPNMFNSLGDRWNRMLGRGAGSGGLQYVGDDGTGNPMVLDDTPPGVEMGALRGAGGAGEGGSLPSGRRAPPAAPLLRQPTGIVSGDDLDLSSGSAPTGRPVITEYPTETVFGKKPTRRTRGAAKTIQKAVRKTRARK
ncbi:MAG: hypothetical protein CMM25_07360 [Rhodospirillaceae bacterium]|nr:hypothetical protein [Rhodospirillaceae bacterium]